MKYYSQENVARLKAYAAAADMNLSGLKKNYVWSCDLAFREGYGSGPLHRIEGNTFAALVTNVRNFCDAYNTGVWNTAIDKNQIINDYKELADDLRDKIAELEKQLALTQAALDGATIATKRRM